MIRFDYKRPDAVDAAVAAGSERNAAFLAGGTNLVDLMKENVARPLEVVDINRLPLGDITEIDGGGLRLGALATNNDTAYHPIVQQHYPLLASAILAGASPQLRNAATNGGNINQRTRCYYFYDVDTPCTKRNREERCGAIGGVNRIHAILGASDKCIATHPSDMAVALAALDAEVRVTGIGGERVIPIGEYHRLPGDEPWRDNTLKPGELVTAIDLPAEHFTTNYTYLKLRDRLSYAFAIVSVAVAMRLEEGKIADVRVALGGVAHKPWRNAPAEDLLIGEAPGVEAFATAARAITEGAVGQGDNDFKIPLARKAIVRALGQAAAGTPQSQTDKRIA
ncbi:xanthine dehydrogenase family protein subunit M [Sphingomonas sp. NBWT7]|uniref:FAD binding domain-containing protein n=1 Tax=Sphingomonas sp. NBWT7 TaxID=2596913 RepID=UPI001629AF3C|nr:xanthine dehydrogenase family protein subunit M [Sphingomonas sp. NBWT7]QNE31577.1 xanthine dehydrogenase family protein subunit M [Sphingomonas sp. NBWT7]